MDFIMMKKQIIKNGQSSNVQTTLSFCNIIAILNHKKNSVGNSVIENLFM